MMFRCLLAGLLILLSTPAMAAADPTGIWALRAEGTTIFRFEISRTATGWTGIWARPEYFQTDGQSFSRISGPVVRRVARQARAIDGVLELTFDDPRPNATPDLFRLHVIDSTHAEADYVGARMEPLALVRVKASAPLGGWNPSHSYVRVIERPTNDEMTAIFDADQKARQSPQAIDWAVVRKEDQQRRLRTQALLDAGALNSGEDFYHAAFVFQHGGTPDDYLKAHLLAIVSVARGKPGAAWIAAATLDRYLQNIGQPQILGTQFTRHGAGAMTQEPYNRTLLPDALRAAMGVPGLDKQEEQRKDYEMAGAAQPVKIVPPASKPAPSAPPANTD